MPRPLVRNRDAALYGGIALWVIGAVLLWDAWEHRGQDRPWTFKLVGVALP